MDNRRVARILYLSYDGMTDSLGQSQVLNYLKFLAQRGYDISLISCEKPERYSEGKDAIMAICAAVGISWHPLLYTRKPPVLSTVYDLWRMWRKIQQLHRQKAYDIVHCRGYMTALLGLLARRKNQSQFLFDMRGFWIDEKIESGEWPQTKFPYRQVISYLRKKESQFYREADHIITLTNAAREVVRGIEPTATITVIPTCVDLELFPPYSEEVKDQVLEELGWPSDSKILVYSGGIGGNYDDRFLLTVYSQLKKQDQRVRLLILTKDPGKKVAGTSQMTDVKYISVPFQQVARYLMAGSWGVVNYKNDFSVAGRSPTKLGEYWACGLAAIAPSGIGDLPVLFNRYPQSGLEMDESSITISVEQLTSDRQRLRAYAYDYFDLQKGVHRYDEVYQHLIFRICNK